MKLRGVIFRVSKLFDEISVLFQHRQQEGSIEVKQTLTHKQLGDWEVLGILSSADMDIRCQSLVVFGWVFFFVAESKKGIHECANNTYLYVAVEKSHKAA